MINLETSCTIDIIKLVHCGEGGSKVKGGPYHLRERQNSLQRTFTCHKDLIPSGPFMIAGIDALPLLKILFKIFQDLQELNLLFSTLAWTDCT